jgi:hypothetical protein
MLSNVLLPGAVLAQQADDFARRPTGEVDATQRGKRTEILAEVAQLEHRDLFSVENRGDNTNQASYEPGA